ncbi:MAG: polysaccharide deacetylase family protein [Oscillospiraceae bacterium]
MSMKFRLKYFICAAIALLIVSCTLTIAFASSRTGGKKTVYLTYDDGPSSNTRELLAVLDKYNVKATFFVTGQFPEYLDCLTEEVNGGHVVAVHTYSHNFPQIYSSSKAFWEDIEKMNDIIFEKTGKRSNLLRFPGGSSNSVSVRYGGRDIMRILAKECDERGYCYFDWNVDTRDSLGAAKPAGDIANAAVSGMKSANSSVVLMHDGMGAKTIAAATEIIIEELLAMGYSFDTLDNLSLPVHHSLY